MSDIQALLVGFGESLRLFAVALALSLTCGSALGLLATRNPRGVGRLVTLFSMVSAAAPPIVVLFWIHYPAQALAGVVASPFISALLAISIIGTGFVSRAIVVTIRDFPVGLEDAARVSGMSSRDTLLFIKGPLLARRFAPHALFIALTVFQMTLLASLIGVEEVFRAALRINSVDYRPIPIFTAVAALCLAFAVPLQVAGVLLSERASDGLAGTKP